MDQQSQTRLAVEGAVEHEVAGIRRKTSSKQLILAFSIQSLLDELNDRQTYLFICIPIPIQDPSILILILTTQSHPQDLI
jgi:hypothetical protein